MATTFTSRVLRRLAPSVSSTTSSASSLPSLPSVPCRLYTQWGLDGKIVPHGGKLVNLMVDKTQGESLLRNVQDKIELSERQSCDVELIINGGFSPLDGFMNQDAYNHVVEKMRLPGSNLLFGIPVVFDVQAQRDDIKPGKKYALTFKGDTIAILDVESRWTPDKALETKRVYGTSSLEHPGTQMVAWERGRDYVGGKLTGLALPKRVFRCDTPEQVRADFPKNTDVVVFQCRNPIHRAHYELFTRALEADNVGKDAVVLVHPTCGPTQQDDIPGDVRYKTYVVLQNETKDTPQGKRTRWHYLPYSMHMAGPREAIQHMMIRKNYGCTHFIIGRDMAGSKSSVDAKDFYGAYDAQDFARQHCEELGMKIVPSLDLVYTAEKDYVTAEDAKKLGLKPVKLSGTEFRRKLRSGEEIPEWFAFKSVVEVLRQHV